MKYAALFAVLMMAGSAHATIFGGADNSVENHGGHGGHGGQGGDGGNATAGAVGVGVGLGVGIGQGGSATGGNATGGTAVQGQQQGQGQDQSQGQGQDQKQLAISGGNKIDGNRTNIEIGGTFVERSAPAVFAGNVPVVAKSCRLYFFGGGSNRDGAVSGTLPIGNDKTCLSGVKLDMMDRIGGFTVAEKQQVACGVEGMENIQTCKNLKKSIARQQGYEGNDERVIDRAVKF